MDQVLGLYVEISNVRFVKLSGELLEQNLFLSIRITCDKLYTIINICDN